MFDLYRKCTTRSPVITADDDLGAKAYFRAVVGGQTAVVWGAGEVLSARERVERRAQMWK